MSRKKVLITGVYGLIAGAIYRHFQAQPGQYDVYALARRREPSRRVRDHRPLDIPNEKFHLADLTDLDALRKAAEGVEVVGRFPRIRMILYTSLGVMSIPSR